MSAWKVSGPTRDAFSAGLVFAPPYEHDGVGVITGGRVSGAAAGGHGSQEGQEGEGGVIRVSGRPVGAFVLSAGKVRWKPAVDVNRLVEVLAAVAIALFAARVVVERARLRRCNDEVIEPPVHLGEPPDEPDNAPDLDGDG